jgi:hypothetical protein
MPKLFAPQEPLLRNAETGLWERNRRINLEPASKFGELVFVWPPGWPGDKASATFNKALDVAERFDDKKDFVINLGSPWLIGLLCWALGKRGKELRVLEWDRRVNDYVPIYQGIPDDE